LTDASYAYFDTSTWLKLYIQEKGSAEARGLARQYQGLSSAVLLLECFSALSRKWISREIDGRKLNRLVKAIQTDVRSLEMIQVNAPVLDKAQEIVLQTLARPLDAVHIASALIFQEMAGVKVLFITSDHRQSDVAVHVGLSSKFVS
jgi:predicted nucleic acid-binding protein